MEPIRTLFTTEAAEPAVLPDALRDRYDGDLSFPPAPKDRPYFIANFVSTLDGVVSFNLPGQSEGSQISGSNEEDHFIMGLLRAAADAVIIGSGTLQTTGPHGAWLPESVYPAAKDLYHQYRTELLRKPDPLVVIVAGTGQLDLTSAVFHTPRTRVLILTTEQGKQKLLQNGAEAISSVEVKALSAAAENRISPSAILTLLRKEYDVELLLHEAGPTLFGEFLEGGFIDELFLTMAPQIAGRVTEHPRPGLVANTEFLPSTAPWWKLLSAKKAAEHLFLRYHVRAT